MRLSGRSRNSLEPPPASTVDDAPPILVARQPIVDADLGLHGYELLFRGPRGSVAEPERWTASLIVDGLAEIGLKGLVGDALAYINVSRAFLLDVDPLPLSATGVVLELTEDSHHTDQRLLERLDQLRQRGYRIALDDFAYDATLDPLIRRADVVKLDVMADGLERTAEVVTALRPYGADLLAEKVETRTEFEVCRDLGCTTFQGYFFARPTEVAGVGVPADKLVGLNTLAEICHPEISFEDLERILSNDVGLSYKLLRYVNSGFFSSSRRVETVREALVRLGVVNVRQWAVVMLMAGATSSPPALISLALLRARLCQRLAADRGGIAADAAFMAGLFSVLDALLNVRMDEALSRLPLSEELMGALISHEGPIGRLLEDVIAIESGSLDVLAGIGAEAYAEASAFADRALSAAV